MIRRLLKIFSTPVKRFYAAYNPVGYARKIGVRMNGDVTIYGSSYLMFSTEPYLVTLGDNVFISVDVRFICHDGSVLPFRKDTPSLDLAAPIRVGSDIFIGARATILKGVEIGDKCIVAAGAIVTKDVPAGSIVGGNPARVIGTTDKFIERAAKNSLGIGNIYGAEKNKRYKEIFNIDQSS